MSGRASALLREERGQSVVLFVVSAVALMGFFALVVNVGHWLQSKRHLQTVADATALAVAQQNYDTGGERGDASDAADAMADTNWDGSVVSGFFFSNGVGQDEDHAWWSIDIETEHEVGYLFSGLLASLGVPLTPLTFSAAARVTVNIPVGLKQVAPIAIKCPPSPASPPPCQRPWPGWTGPGNGGRTWALDPADTSPTSPDAESFDYRPANPDLGRFMPIKAFPGATLNDIQDAVSFCDPSVQNACGLDVPSTPTDLDFLEADPALTDAENANALRDALRNAGSWPQLVPVYDRIDTTTDPAGVIHGTVHVIGFAAFSFCVDESPCGLGAPPFGVEITGTFHKMFYDTALLAHQQDADTHGLYDFGVRTIALSK